MFFYGDSAEGKQLFSVKPAVYELCLPLNERIVFIMVYIVCNGLFQGSIIQLFGDCHWWVE